MTRTLAALALCVSVLLCGCAQSDAYDDFYDLKTSAVGGVVVGADAPINFVGGVWTDPYEVPASDITLADAPRFAMGLVDPYQVLPPPFGTFYAPWKLFVSIVKSFPFITWTEDEGRTSVTWTAGEYGSPLWYVVGPALEDLDSYVMAPRETVASDHTPVPGNGRMGEYWRIRANHHWAKIKHAGYTIKYVLLNTNSNLPPYDDFFPDQMLRSKTTIHKTLDTFLFGFDWDDPYIN